MLDRLTGKVAVVTGASRGIGRAIALQFAKNHYHVILNCSTSLEQLENVKKEILALPDGSCTCCRCDVSDSSQVTAMFEEISATCGQIDVLINNAGISHIGLFTDMTDDLWNRMIQTNLSSVFYCSRATLPSMISRKKGKIINISSMNAYTPLTKIPAYSGAKAAISNFTEWLAVHFSKVGIRCNAIAPGFFSTQQNAKLLFNEDGTPTARTGKILNNTPMDRFGEVEELIGSVLFLACEEASGFVNGACIPIDGAFAAYSGV